MLDILLDRESTSDSGCEDLPGALSAAEVSESLGLTAIRNRQWAIFQTSALKGSGINEGLDWLVSVLASA